MAQHAFRPLIHRPPAPDVSLHLQRVYQSFSFAILMAYDRQGVKCTLMQPMTSTATHVPTGFFVYFALYQIQAHLCELPKQRERQGEYTVDKHHLYAANKLTNPAIALENCDCGDSCLLVVRGRGPMQFEGAFALTSADTGLQLLQMRTHAIARNQCTRLTNRTINCGHHFVYCLLGVTWSRGVHEWTI